MHLNNSNINPTLGILNTDGWRAAGEASALRIELLEDGLAEVVVDHVRKDIGLIGDDRRARDAVRRGLIVGAYGALEDEEGRVDYASTDAFEKGAEVGLDRIELVLFAFDVAADVVPGFGQLVCFHWEGERGLSLIHI